MIITKTLEDGRTYTYSDREVKIRQETGAIYESAVDTVAHLYTETDEPLDPEYTDAPTAEDYENALAELGVK